VGLARVMRFYAGEVRRLIGRDISLSDLYFRVDG